MLHLGWSSAAQDKTRARVPFVVSLMSSGAPGMGTLMVKRLVVSTMSSSLEERSKMGMFGVFFQVAREVEGFFDVLVLVRVIVLESKGKL